MDHVEYVYTVGMTEEEVGARLSTAETGVLSLADGSRAYAVPVGFHYTGDGRLLFRLSDDDGSTKLAYASATEEACFLLYGHEGPDESWSVVCTGPLSPLSEAEAEAAAFDDTIINERFDRLRLFDESVDDVDLVLYALDVDTVTGRRTLA
jgi:hypothetical protein